MDFYRFAKKGFKEVLEFFNKNSDLVRDIDFKDHCRPDDHPLPHQHTHEDNPTGGTKARNPEAEQVPEWNYEKN